MENFIKEFSENLLGNLSLAVWASGMVLALIGAILSLRLAAKKRDKLSDNTPYQFSWKFMLQDNAQRLFTGFLITFAAFRFAPEILHQDFSMFLAFLVGLCSDQVAALISKLEIGARNTDK
ncbi:MAG: hypothetical protein H7202_13035 [Pedobacter sp.]|nr:hypothetical protein [Pedobacter sp.]